MFESSSLFPLVIICLRRYACVASCFEKDMDFPGEAFLPVHVPNYEREGACVSAVLFLLPFLWFIFIPSAVYKTCNHDATKSFLSSLMAPFTVLAFMTSFIVVVLYFNPHNHYTLRRVFQAPILKRAECQAILEMADECSQRNVHEFGNSTAELLEEPKGWFKRRDPIYPTTDLHFIMDPFTKEERIRLGNLLDRRLGPLVSRVYGIPKTALRINDLFLVRYDERKKVSLIPHTDNSDISFNILLNDNFTGGGTQFLRRSIEDQETNTPFALVRPRRGECLIHGSQILHEGYPISSGTRIIIVGFFSVDRVDPFGNQQKRRYTTGLPWMASWFSIHWLNVKLKDAYTFSDRRLERKVTDSPLWDHVYVQSLRRDLINLVKILGDTLGTHELVHLVDRSQYDEYYDTLDGAYKGTSAVNWFRGQHVDVDFTGQVERQWITRVETPEKFSDQRLPKTFGTSEL